MRQRELFEKKPTVGIKTTHGKGGVPEMPVITRQVIVRIELAACANRWKHLPFAEIERKIHDLYVGLHRRGLLPFRGEIVRSSVFHVWRDESGTMVVKLPDVLREWLGIKPPSPP